MGNIITASNGYKWTNTSGADIVAGTPVVNSKLFGVAQATIASGAAGWIATDGVWSLPCGASVTASVGDVAYWDSSNAVITATASTNLPVGYFVSAVTSGAAAADVRLGVYAQAASGSGSGAGV